MRKHVQGAGLLVYLLGAGFVVLVVVVGSAFSASCTGGTACASTACTETAPCTVNGTVYSVGSVCAAGVAGAVCKSHWFAADCKCTNVVRAQGQGPIAACTK